ncbi:hypothetical protein C8J56DRAFT_898093 [Mycena floridula]|nr:hypothetical protein C8J56DRAFT_898093 [Mycena floridula]
MHSITFFNHVKLPASAFLGDLNSKVHPRLQFLKSIWRLSIGAIVISGLIIQGLRQSAYIVTQYAKRRQVTTSQGTVVPILSFRTTHAPILRALAQAAVLERLCKEIRPFFVISDGNYYVPGAMETRNGVSAAYKTVSIIHWRATILDLTNRLGARGLYLENQLIAFEIHNPAARYPESLLARHESIVLAEMKKTLADIGGDHRSEAFNRLRHRPTLCLRNQPLTPKVDSTLIAVYEVTAVLDFACYVEHGLLTRQKALDMEVTALNESFPKLDSFCESSNASLSTAFMFSLPANSNHGPRQVKYSNLSSYCTLCMHYMTMRVLLCDCYCKARVTSLMDDMVLVFILI